MEFRLLGAALVGTGAMLATLRLRGSGDARSRELGDQALSALVVGLLVGRLTAMVSAGTNPLLHPTDVIVVRAGVDTVGASLGALGWVSLSLRRSLSVSLDDLAVPALAGLVGWHAGCLIREACLGTASSLPWAVPQSSGGVPRHPVELYAAGLLLVVAVITARLRSRAAQGSAAASAVAGAGAVRLLTEPLRPSLGGGPVSWYLAAVLLGLMGMLLVAIRDRGSGVPEG